LEHYFAYLSTADLQTKFDVESEPFLERLAGMGQSISDEAFSTLSEEFENDVPGTAKRRKENNVE